ncbi:MAG: hypothetical protein U0M00_03465 [Clostridia bacterium]|nr:hypothetical protein [Clostridia bacterium]
MEKAKTNKIFDLGIDFSNKKPIEIARYIFILFITDVIARIWLGNNFIREQNGLELPFGLANIKH